MKYVGRVQGSGAMAVPVYVGTDRVDVHKNIERVLTPDPISGEIPEDLWEYDEYQYTRDEYFALLGENEQKNDVQQTRQDAQIEYIAMMTDVDLEA